MVKAQLAKEMAKKNQALRLQVRTTEDMYDKAKNILFTVYTHIYTYIIYIISLKRSFKQLMINMANLQDSYYQIGSKFNNLEKITSQINTNTETQAVK